MDQKCSAYWKTLISVEAVLILSEIQFSASLNNVSLSFPYLPLKFQNLISLSFLSDCCFEVSNSWHMAVTIYPNIKLEWWVLYDFSFRVSLILSHEGLLIEFLDFWNWRIPDIPLIRVSKRKIKLCVVSLVLRGRHMRIQCYLCLKASFRISVRV